MAKKQLSKPIFMITVAKGSVTPEDIENTKLALCAEGYVPIVVEYHPSSYQPNYSVFQP